MAKIEFYRGKMDGNFFLMPNGAVDSELMVKNRLLVYTVIRRHLNISNMVAFPGLTTIMKKTGLSKNSVIQAIKDLEELGILTVRREKTKYNENKVNRYYFNDTEEMWKALTAEEMKQFATETEIERSIRILEAAGFTVVDKIKEPVEAPPATDSAHDLAKSFDSYSKNNTNNANYQETNDTVKKHFHYDILISSRPDLTDTVNWLMDILTDIWLMEDDGLVSGTRVNRKRYLDVISKLYPDEILGCLDSFRLRNDLIRNPRAYVLKILYNRAIDINEMIDNEIRNDMKNI